jgi:hypothetical protein
VVNFWTPIPVNFWTPIDTIADIGGGAGRRHTGLIAGWRHHGNSLLANLTVPRRALEYDFATRRTAIRDMLVQAMLPDVSWLRPAPSNSSIDLLDEPDPTRSPDEMIISGRGHNLAHDSES